MSKLCGFYFFICTLICKKLFLKPSFSIFQTENITDILLQRELGASPTLFCLSFPDFPTHLSGNRKRLTASSNNFEQSSVWRAARTTDKMLNFFHAVALGTRHACSLSTRHTLHFHLTYVLYITRDKRVGGEGVRERDLCGREIMWEKDKALSREPQEYTSLFLRMQPVTAHHPDS